MEQQVQLKRAAGDIPALVTPAIEHARAQRDVTEQRSGPGQLERAGPGVGLELTNVMKQRSREHEVPVRAGDGGDGAPDAGDLEGVAQQAAQRCVVSRGARRALLVTAAKGRIVVEEADYPGQRGRANGRAPAIQRGPATA